MKTYELTYIISSGLGTEEAEKAKTDIESFIQSKEGIILKSEKSGPQPLSYHIKGQSSGSYNTATFQIEENKIKEIKGSVDKNEQILRSVIVVKNPVKAGKAIRTRRTMPAGDFAMKSKPAMMEPGAKEKKREEKVNEVDLDKKLDEILSE